VETPETIDDGILLPFALDPNTAPGPSPLNRPTSKFADRNLGSEGKNSRDYFNRPSADHREVLKENGSRSGSTERRRPTSPHIAYQEKGRQPSDSLVETLRKRKEVAGAPAAPDRSRSQHASPAPSSAAEPFKLQDVPRNKKAEAKRKDSESKESLQMQLAQHNSPSAPVDMSARLSRPLIEPDFTSSPPAAGQDSPDTSESSFSSHSRPERTVERPARGDSLSASVLKPAASITRSDRSVPASTTPAISHPERTSSTTTATAQLNAGLGIIQPADSPSSKSSSDVPVPPARSAGRPPPPSQTFTSPRAPPQPPPPQTHRTNESMSSAMSEASRDDYGASGLPRYSHQGDFSMDEDFARLLGSQGEKDERDGGVFRRVSNAVSKHGRSFSDRGSINSKGHKKWPTNGSVEISSPTVASPDTREEGVNLRNELRRAQQRIAELEAEKNGLQESMHSAADIRQANTVLREKRNTMAVLDTQREVVIRELEIMTDHLKRAKDSNGSMDLNQLKSDILRDFGNSLHKLKDQLSGQIEDLISKRAEMTDEISNLIQMKDKGFQEYESLTAANAKLNAMNRELVEGIQKTLQSNKKGTQSLDATANGLGIYNSHSHNHNHNHNHNHTNTQHKGGKSDVSIDVHNLPHEQSYANLHEADGEAQLAQPQVVNIRKTGKPTKFSTWKKGGQAITKNVTKGFKGAFGSDAKQEDYNIKVIGTPYGSVHTQPDLASMSTMSTMSSSVKSKDEQGTPRAWFSGNKPPSTTRPYPQDRFKSMQLNNSSTNLSVDASAVLFGSDLTARCEFEKQMIPRIVSRCIEEVELRGKSSNSIVRALLTDAFQAWTLRAFTAKVVAPLRSIRFVAVSRPTMIMISPIPTWISTRSRLR
jgi:hypothetical protein